MTLVAGIDSSTQSCKVLVIDAESGVVVRRGGAPHPDSTEVDPEEWWRALRTAVGEAGGLGDVAAVSIAAQQHGMVALDAGGRVLRPALLWNDTRSAGAARDLVAEFGAADLARRTGSVPVASFTSTKLRWLRDAEPAVAAEVAAVALPHDWLTWRLRGFGPARPELAELVTDRSDASGTGYWNPATGDYELDLLSLGPGVVLPRVLAPSEPAGPSSGGLVVGPGAGDNAAAALGLDARPGDAIVSIGTSGTAFAVTTGPVADASGTVAGFADATGLFLPLVATLNAARPLEVVARLLGVGWAEFDELALNSPPGADGVVLLPYFAGERTPDLPDATASLLGLSLGSATRENVARAAIEGVLCGLAVGIDALRAVDVPIERILLIGGGAQSPAVQHIATEVFDVPVRVPELAEYVALGAARQAAWTLTGERPTWPVPMTRIAESRAVPAIRAQFAQFSNPAQSPNPAQFSKPSRIAST